MIEFLDKLDKSIFLFLNGIHSPFWDNLMYWISGDTSWLFLYIILLIGLAIKYRWRMIFVVLAVALVITASDQFSVHFFKEIFMRLRPCHDPEISGLVHIVNDHCGGKFGFVSSHAANTFALAMLTSGLFKNKYFTWFIFAWATIVSYSRIYLGVHYPGDIIGGALLGIFLGWVVFLLYQYLDNKVVSRIQFFK
ncbi:MAG: phosphatase PAP2 family protein [Bacteroidales bacterium]|nr:phosphatase PAP2 family protein [Bacteroidales bacterium]